MTPTLTLGDLTLSLDDPRVWAVGLAVLLGAFLLFATIRATRAAQHAAARVEALSSAQAQAAQGLDARLAGLSVDLGASVSGAATHTAATLGELRERLAAIDRAQANIERLSGDVLSLQDVLSNKQARGAFGEIQLRDLVQKALPPDAYRWQATLSNGRRADCLLALPDPPGAIVIDAKFPLEPYEALLRAETEAERRAAARGFRTAVRGHVRAIAERYILTGETAESALMFLPSEAVFAELHANFADVVREGFAARVWIVSPTTTMAVLNTLRAVLKDVRLRKEAAAIRSTLRLLQRDVELVAHRVGNLRTHFAQAQGDLDGLETAARRAGTRAERLETMDFDPGDAPQPDPSPQGGVRIVRS